MNHDAGEHNGEKANTVTKRNLRKNLEREGLKEVVCHLDPYTLKLLNDYCLTLGYNDPSESRARKAKTYSQALTQLILEKLGKKAQDMPKTRKGLELFRLRAIVKEITENGGMTDEAAAKHMTDRGHLPPKFVLNNTKPTRSERVWTVEDITHLKDIEKVKSKIKNLNQKNMRGLVSTNKKKPSKPKS